MSRLAPIGIACLLLAGAGASADEPPTFSDQRLFTTADQRARLDDLRAGRHVERAGGDGARAPVHARTPPSVRLEGFVQRSDGPPAVWVNDRNTLSGDRIDDDIRVRSGRIEGDTVVIELPGGRTIRLKPGQTWDPKTGHVHDPGEG